MVHIVAYKQLTNSSTGVPFNVLVIEGDIEMVQSTQTGRFYATARRASIPATFNEETCKRIIGKSLPGSIIKEQVDPYEYTLPETGEVISLSHRYGYSPTGKNEDAVFDTRGQQSTEQARTELMPAGAM
jgi:hypothetical protein